MSQINTSYMTCFYHVSNIHVETILPRQYRTKNSLILIKNIWSMSSSFSISLKVSWLILIVWLSLLRQNNFDKMRTLSCLGNQISCKHIVIEKVNLLLSSTTLRQFSKQFILWSTINFLWCARKNVIDSINLRVSNYSPIS